MPLPFIVPPKNLCILRLSAIGDISHALPVVRTIQEKWPDTKLAWIIGRIEHDLVYDLPGIEFIIFDKARRWRAYADLKRAMAGRRFDALLHMQMSLRASLASLLVPTDIRLGFDRRRANDFQWLFTTHKIPAHERQHVVDSFFGFAEALGISKRVLRWDIPIPDSARAYAESRLPGDTPTLAISPCSSMSYRNWNATGYAAVADYAIEHHGMRVVLTGGPTAIEADYGKAICAVSRHPVINLIGETDLKQLLAVLAKAAVVIAPDSGPAHLATAVGTPVIGLYATTNPDRARPYLSAEYVVNRYPEAVIARYGTTPDKLPWGTRVRDPGTMERITVADVTARLDVFFDRAG